jgi:hypothetical protein
MIPPSFFPSLMLKLMCRRKEKMLATFQPVLTSEKRGHKKPDANYKSQSEWKQEVPQ